MTISRAYALEHFDEICERAENGEDIVLERPGKAGLALVPKPVAAPAKTAEEAVESIRRRLLAQQPFPGKIDYKALINEGRRF